MSRSGHRDRRGWVCLAAIFLVALGLRAVHVTLLYGEPLGLTLIQDARHYHEAARGWLGGESPAQGAGFMNPGYTWFLVGVYAVSGDAPWAAIGLQVLLGAASAAALAWIARALLASDAASWTCGLLYAAYVPAIFYDGLLLTPSIVNVLLIAALVALVAGRTDGRRAAPLVAGLAVGAAAVVRPNLLLLLPALAPAWRDRSRVVLFLAAALAVVLPGVVANGLRHGEWVPLSANGGVNFWIGNNSRAEGIYHAADFVSDVAAAGERQGFLDEARRRSGNPALGLVDADRFWLGRGLESIAADPLRWLRVEGRKLALFFNHHESKTNVGLAFAREFSPLLRGDPLGFGPLAVAGSLGFVLLLAEGRRLAAGIVACLVAVPLITCVVFFVSGEYRHPAAIGLCLAASVALCRVGGIVRGRWAGARTWTRGLGYGLIVALLFVPLVYWPFPPLERTLHSRLDYSNHARAIVASAPRESRSYERALALLDHAGSLAMEDPFLLEARLYVTGRAAAELGDAAMARRFLDTAAVVLSLGLEPDPETLPPRFFRQLHGTLRHQAAAMSRREAVRAHPDVARRLELLLRVPEHPALR